GASFPAIASNSPCDDFPARIDNRPVVSFVRQPTSTSRHLQNPDASPFGIRNSTILQAVRVALPSRSLRGGGAVGQASARSLRGALGARPPQLRLDTQQPGQRVLRPGKVRAGGGAPPLWS